MADIWVQKDEGTAYFFRVRNNGARMVLTSKGFKTKKACMEAIEKFKESSLDDNNYERKVDDKGVHRFTLTADNGKFKAGSSIYSSPAELEQGILNVRDCLQTGVISFIPD